MLHFGDITKLSGAKTSHILFEGRKYYVCSDGTVITERGKILSQFMRKGYRYVELRSTKGKKKCSVHRIVATAFLENPEGLPQVNHKDGDKCNNDVSNLEWVNGADNQLHSRYKLHNQTGFKDTPVMCVETGRQYVSTRDAWRDTGCNYTHISECVHGKRKTCGGYHWRRIDEALR